MVIYMYKVKRYNMFNIFSQKLNKHKKAKVGLALGGGATRGFAHLGAMRAFEEAGIQFDYVAGTSAGSLAGALYSAGLSYEQMYEIAKDIDAKDIKTSKVFFVPSKTTGIQNIIQDAIGNINFSQLKVPFAAVAVDLISGDEVVITRGNVAKAVAGSCAVPGFFAPVDFENMHLSDGGLQNNIPSDVLRLYDCDYVIAIDVNSTRGQGTESTKVLDVLAASLRIMMKSNSVKGYINADIVIQPDTKRFKSTKVEGMDEMIEEGSIATKERIPEILRLISKRPKRKKSCYNEIYPPTII